MADSSSGVPVKPRLWLSPKIAPSAESVGKDEEVAVGLTVGVTIDGLEVAVGGFGVGVAVGGGEVGMAVGSGVAVGVGVGASKTEIVFEEES